MKDYYYILGINKNASNNEIKAAYRKLSKKIHPDVNDGDKFFEERFKQIQEAYEILSNASKRHIYDEDYFQNDASEINRKYTSVQVKKETKSYSYFAILIIFLIMAFFLIRLFLNKGISAQNEINSNNQQNNIENFLLTTEPAILLSKVKSTIGNNVVFLETGNFNQELQTQIIAGLEIESNDVWGIQFVMMKYLNNNFIEIYRSSVLEGSFHKSQTEAIKLKSNDYEVLYYNSRDYFVGSRGGEVFSYIIDFNKQEVYYAHLILDKGILLFISPNTQQDEIKNLFTSNFQKDYPELKIILEDISLY